MFKRNFSCALACALFINGPVLAAEGSVYGGPIGGTDIRNAYVAPFPGFYFGFADVYADLTQFNGNNGGKSATIRRVDLTLDITAAGLTYVYPFKPFQGILSSGVQQAYYPLYRFSVNNMTDHVGGWGDLYSDIIKYTKSFASMTSPPSGNLPLPYGLVAQATYSMIFPTGRYNNHQISAPGHNTYFIIPNFALTYLTLPNRLGDGVEFSGRVFYDHSTLNNATSYQSGDVIDLDWGISERNGRLQYGVIGTAASQLQDDKIHGRMAPTNGNRLVDVEVGPVVAYDLPKTGLFLKAKAAWDVYARNHILGPQAVFELGLKL